MVNQTLLLICALSPICHSRRPRLENIKMPRQKGFHKVTFSSLKNFQVRINGSSVNLKDKIWQTKSEKPCWRCCRRNNIFFKIYELILNDNSSSFDRIAKIGHPTSLLYGISLFSNARTACETAKTPVGWLPSDYIKRCSYVLIHNRWSHNCCFDNRSPPNKNEDLVLAVADYACRAAAFVKCFSVWLIHQWGCERSPCLLV